MFPPISSVWSQKYFNAYLPDYHPKTLYMHHDLTPCNTYIFNVALKTRCSLAQLFVVSHLLQFWFNNWFQSYWKISFCSIYHFYFSTSISYIVSHLCSGLLISKLSLMIIASNCNHGTQWISYMYRWKDEKGPKSISIKHNLEWWYLGHNVANWNEQL